MKTIADLADPATTKTSIPRGPALAAFDAATRPTRVLVEANGTTVEILCGGAGARPGYYRMAVNQVKSDKGPIGATLETVKRLVAGLEAPLLKPTPAARAYEQFAFWADVQDGYIMTYAMFADGGWDEDPSAVEFACQHMLDAVNADFGSDFTMDEFQEGDCTCTD
jgi:hypothetical protein